MDYKNDYKECGIMINENNPSKRNQNNNIKFNLLDKFKIEVGDRIKHNLGNGKFSVYEITDVLNVRKSTLSNFNYCECLIKWYEI